MANTPYRRLTGRRRSISGFSQLWLGSDHLLLVKSSRLVEDYQRFELADIQALVVTETPDPTIARVIVALIGLAILGFSFTAQFFGFIEAVGVGVGGVILAGVIVDIALGGRCRCHLHTAVSQEFLSPVSRMRTARKFLSAVRPAVESVQGALGESPSLPAIESGSSAFADRPPELPQALSRLPDILFVLLLVDAVIAWAGGRFPKTEVGNILFTSFIAELAIAIGVFWKRSDRDPRRLAYLVAASALVCGMVDFYGFGHAFVSAIAQAMDKARTAKVPQPQPMLFWNVDPAQWRFAATWRAAAGSLGLAASYLERKRGGSQ